MIDVARFECLPNRFGRDGVECLREVDRRCPHFDEVVASKKGEIDASRTPYVVFRTVEFRPVSGLTKRYPGKNLSMFVSVLVVFPDVYHDTRDVAVCVLHPNCSIFFLCSERVVRFHCCFTKKSRHSRTRQDTRHGTHVHEFLGLPCVQSTYELVSQPVCFRRGGVRSGLLRVAVCF